MTAQEDRQEKAYAEISEIGNRVRYIQREVDSISSRMDDHYRILREILDSRGVEANGDWDEPDWNDDELIG